MLDGKKVLLGVTGSIAAYKAASLTRLLIKQGAEVKVVMTSLAKEFITPLTLATLSKSPIMVDFFDPTNGAWNSHVSLGVWADAYLIAPATANTIGKMAHGIADNLLLTTYFSARCPVFVAPAMDMDMYAHPATRHNLDMLRRRNCHIIEPASGELASGLEGKGRMEEPEQIVRYLDDFFTGHASLAGEKIMITAGPTYEKIDPVRFIGNYSSGKMGFALAEACARRGAEVTLIAGPVSLQCTNHRIRLVRVESAEEMYQAALSCYPQSSGAILCAAVADFTPTQQAPAKLKRNEGAMQLSLQPTRDIAAALGEIRQPGQFLVGFALETDHEEQHAKEKMERKRLDFIVLNSLNDPGAGFASDTNKVTILSREGAKKTFPLKPKTQVAEDIADEVELLLTTIKQSSTHEA